MNDFSSKSATDSFAFLAVAVLSSTNRLGRFFPGATSKGLLLQGLITGIVTYIVNPDKKLYKIASVAFSSLLSDVIARTLKGRVSLPLKSNVKLTFLFASVTILKTLITTAFFDSSKEDSESNEQDNGRLDKIKNEAGCNDKKRNRPSFDNKSKQVAKVGCSVLIRSSEIEDREIPADKSPNENERKEEVDENAADSNPDHELRKKSLFQRSSIASPKEPNQPFELDAFKDSDSSEEDDDRLAAMITEMKKIEKIEPFNKIEDRDPSPYRFYNENERKEEVDRNVADSNPDHELRKKSLFQRSSIASPKEPNQPFELDAFKDSDSSEEDDDRLAAMITEQNKMKKIERIETFKIKDRDSSSYRLYNEKGQKEEEDPYKKKNNRKQSKGKVEKDFLNFESELKKKCDSVKLASYKCKMKKLEGLHAECFKRFQAYLESNPLETEADVRQLIKDCEEIVVIDTKREWSPYSRKYESTKVKVGFFQLIHRSHELAKHCFVAIHDKMGLYGDIIEAKHDFMTTSTSSTKLNNSNFYWTETSGVDRDIRAAAKDGDKIHIFVAACGPNGMAAKRNGEPPDLGRAMEDLKRNHTQGPAILKTVPKQCEIVNAFLARLGFNMFCYSAPTSNQDPYFLTNGRLFDPREQKKDRYGNYHPKAWRGDKLDDQYKREHEKSEFPCFEIRSEKSSNPVLVMIGGSLIHRPILEGESNSTFITERVLEANFIAQFKLAWRILNKYPKKSVVLHIPLLGVNSFHNDPDDFAFHLRKVTAKFESHIGKKTCQRFFLQLEIYHAEVEEVEDPEPSEGEDSERKNKKQIRDRCLRNALKKAGLEYQERK